RLNAVCPRVESPFTERFIEGLNERLQKILEDGAAAGLDLDHGRHAREDLQIPVGHGAETASLRAHADAIVGRFVIAQALLQRVSADECQATAEVPVKSVVIGIDLDPN